jgi:hypothetical protein
MQNTMASLMYLIEDYDCTYPGTVRYGTGTYGTRYVFDFIFFNHLSAVDRGGRPHLGAYRRCPHLQSIQQAAALPEPTIPHYIFLSHIGNIFSY